MCGMVDVKSGEYEGRSVGYNNLYIAATYRRA